MQATLLALTVWYYGYYPTRSVARGRHASRTPSKASRFCAAQLLAVSLLWGRAGQQQCANSGRHRVSEHRVRRTTSTVPPRPHSHARGHDPAFWRHQQIKSRSSRSRMGAHG